MAVYKNEELKRHSKLLQHFFNEDVTLETQAVYALQSLVHSLQHPPNVLQQIFDTCYDEDIISEAAFRAWYDATDREEDGKGSFWFELAPLLWIVFLVATKRIFSSLCRSAVKAQSRPILKFPSRSRPVPYCGRKGTLHFGLILTSHNPIYQRLLLVIITQ